MNYINSTLTCHFKEFAKALMVNAATSGFIAELAMLKEDVCISLSLRKGTFWFLDMHKYLLESVDQTKSFNAKSSFNCDRDRHIFPVFIILLALTPSKFQR